MKVFPAVHYSMGGLWVDAEQMTSLVGLFAAGECEYQYHGANRLGANSLLSCIYGGGVAATKAMEYIEGDGAVATTSDLEGEKLRQEETFSSIMKMDGRENPYKLHDELGELMTANVTVVRDNAKLDETLTKIAELKERYANVGLADTGKAKNQSLHFTRQLHHMLELAHLITLGARLRDESRGAHYKPEFPNRDDENYLKTTLANYTPEGPVITYEEVDTQHIKPRPRNYAAS